MNELDILYGIYGTNDERDAIIHAIAVKRMMRQAERTTQALAVLTPITLDADRLAELKRALGHSALLPAFAILSFVLTLAPAVVAVLS